MKIEIKCNECTRQNQQDENDECVGVVRISHVDGVAVDLKAIHESLKFHK